MSADRIYIVTSLTPAECEARLSSAIDAQGTAPFFLDGWRGTKPVIGHVTGSSLSLRKRIGYRNSFQSVLTATIRSDAGGTVISGQVGMNPLAQGGMLVWFGLLVIIGGAMFIGTLGSMLLGAEGGQGLGWAGILVPPLMMTFGIGLVCFGRDLAKDEAHFLEEFLIRTLDSRTQDK